MNEDNLKVYLEVQYKKKRYTATKLVTDTVIKQLFFMQRILVISKIIQVLCAQILSTDDLLEKLKNNE